jgi:Phage integrase, N-terminal SAM-like domain
MILDKTRRGGSLPTTDEVDRRLGAGRDLDRSMTTGEWLDEWFAGKHDLRRTTRRYYASNIRVYLKPRLGDIPLDRLRITHLTAMFEWIEATNHTRRRPVGRATMRQIRGTLRSSLSDAVRQGLVTRNVAKDVRVPGGRIATLLLAATHDLKLVQELLGHSTITLTGNTYTTVLPEVAREAAEGVAHLIRTAVPDPAVTTLLPPEPWRPSKRSRPAEKPQVKQRAACRNRTDDLPLTRRLL